MEYETNQGVGKLSEEVGLFFGRFPESTEKCNVLRWWIHRFARSSASFCIFEICLKKQFCWLWCGGSLLCFINIKTDPFLAVILGTFDPANHISYFCHARLVKRLIKSFALLYKINFTITSKSRLARALIWTHDINTVAVRGTIVFARCTKKPVIFLILK